VSTRVKDHERGGEFGWEGGSGGGEVFEREMVQNECQGEIDQAYGSD